MTKETDKKSTIQTSTKTASRTQTKKTQANGLSVHTGTRAGSQGKQPKRIREIIDFKCCEN